jgi:plasmid stabilization system protein ParE
MAKRIVFSKNAELDLERIIEFNNRRNRSNSYSKKLYTRIITRLHLLLEQPMSGMETDDEDFLLIWDDYYIFYTLNTNAIEISAIYHQKENITR